MLLGLTIYNSINLDVAFPTVVFKLTGQSGGFYDFRVNINNVHQYVDQYADFLLNKSIQKSVSSFFSKFSKSQKSKKTLSFTLSNAGLNWSLNIAPCRLYFAPKRLRSWSLVSDRTIGRHWKKTVNMMANSNPIIRLFFT